MPSDTDDCQAFLDGHLAEYLVTHGRYVPGWVWTNLLAHGTESELRRQHVGVRRLPRSGHLVLVDDWRAGRAFLAGELLELAANCCPLDQLQRSTIVPFELRLAAREEAASWRLDEWVIAVETELTKHRIAHRRSTQGEQRGRC